MARARARERSSSSATYDFECDWAPFPGAPPCEFTSTEWPTKRQRDERAAAHRAEHETGEPMVEIGEFRDPEQHRAVLKLHKAV